MAGTAIGLIVLTDSLRQQIRWWNRAIVVRQARAHRLRLIGIVELHADGEHNGLELLHLTTLATTHEASALVTYGVHPHLARSLAADLGLRHIIAPAATT